MNDHFSRNTLSLRLVASFVALAPILTFSQTGKLYLVRTEPLLYEIQAGQVNWVRPTVGQSELGIAVYGDIRTVQQYNPFGGQILGQKYDLQGNALGQTYQPLIVPDFVTDGTTDGVKNWTLSGNNVYSTDRNWQNLELEFSVSGGGFGISCNPLDGSLWISTNSGIKHFTQSGQFLGNVIPDYGSVAFDPNDGTIWTNFQGPDFYQYSQSGVLLDHKVINGLASPTPFGMEFDTAVPEPTSILFLSTMVALVAKRRKSSNAN